MHPDFCINKLKNHLIVLRLTGLRVSISFNLDCLIERLHAVHISVRQDLFDLVHMLDNQQFLWERLLYQTTMYTLFASPVNNNIISKNQQNTTKTKTIKLLSNSAKNILRSNTFLSTSKTKNQTSKLLEVHYIYVIYLMASLYHYFDPIKISKL